MGFTNAEFEESVWRRPADDKYAADIIINCHVDDSLIAFSSLLVMRKGGSSEFVLHTGNSLAGNPCVFANILPFIYVIVCEQCVSRSCN